MPYGLRRAHKLVIEKFSNKKNKYFIAKLQFLTSACVWMCVYGWMSKWESERERERGRYFQEINSYPLHFWRVITPVANYLHNFLLQNIFSKLSKKPNIENRERVKKFNLLVKNFNFSLACFLFWSVFYWFVSANCNLLFRFIANGMSDKPDKNFDDQNNCCCWSNWKGMK